MAAYSAGGGTFLSSVNSPPSAALSLSYNNRERPYLLLMERLSEEEGALAITIAKDALSHRVAGLPAEIISLPAIFQEKRGVFVTLTKAGELRGCIGFPYPVMLLKDAINDAAIAAATEDPRFPAVKKEELASLTLEVTVLTIPQIVEGDPTERGSKVITGKHGLIVKGLGRSGLLLPQVATEYGWDELTFLSQTCRKAGLPGDCWKRPDISLFTFEGQIFHTKRA